MDAARPRSTSQSSSNQELPADNIQINVNINSEKTIKLNVQPTHSVSNVIEFLSASTTLPTNVRLYQDGKQLQPQTTVAELALTDSSVLTAATEPTKPTTTTATTAARTPKKSNKPRCSKEGCKTVAQPIVGDCGFCQQRFCGKHRMLESHNCTGLDDARQADKARNTAKLEGERTVMLRGL